MSEVRYQRWLFEHTHMKVSWIKYSTEQKDEILTYPPPVYSLPSPPYGTSIAFHKQSPPSPSSSPKINPAVLFIIVILAVLFFISGLLHLLVRFLTKHQSSTSSQSDRPEVSSRSDALERQLQQLFHLHDSGLDQAFIDALPVFMYKEVVGSKEPFDCAVCLCEFTDKDKLRLLPTCSHAFHISCIDTWLLSNSTCPLCRGTLFSPGFSMENPMFDFDDPSDDGCHGNRRYALSSNQKTIEIEESVVESGVLPVRLGKFRKLKDGSDDAGGETSSSNLDARRCYSMGSYQYVVADTSLEVALNNVRDGNDAKLVKRKECSNSSFPDGDDDGKKISIGTKTDSYSVSKIWLWSKKGQFSGSSGTQMDYSSSLDHELPWMRKTEGI